jgi:hypothetical protein
MVPSVGSVEKILLMGEYYRNILAIVIEDTGAGFWSLALSPWQKLHD